MLLLTRVSEFALGIDATSREAVRYELARTPVPLLLLTALPTPRRAEG